jgi:hypothetical protein
VIPGRVEVRVIDLPSAEHVIGEVETGEGCGGRADDEETSPVGTAAHA